MLRDPEFVCASYEELVETIAVVEQGGSGETVLVARWSAQRDVKQHKLQKEVSTTAPFIGFIPIPIC